MSSGYRIRIPPTTELHRREIELRVAQLRAVFAANEQWFLEPDEIVAYMNECGFRQNQDRLITKHTLPAWRKRLAFPYANLQNTKIQAPRTSNLMIMGWLWSLR